MGDLGTWEGSEWIWDLRWRRHLFVWETEFVVTTRHSLSDREDGWSWTQSPDGRYSVKSTYSHLLKGLLGSSAPHGAVLQAVSRVWKSCAPSIVIVFSWQLIIDRILTRRNLVRCGVPLPDGGLGCVFCGAPSELSVHLFLSCHLIFPAVSGV